MNNNRQISPPDFVLVALAFAVGLANGEWWITVVILIINLVLMAIHDYSLQRERSSR